MSSSHPLLHLFFMHTFSSLLVVAQQYSTAILCISRVFCVLWNFGWYAWHVCTRGDCKIIPDSIPYQCHVCSFIVQTAKSKNRLSSSRLLTSIWSTLRGAYFVQLCYILNIVFVHKYIFFYINISTKILLAAFLFTYRALHSINM